MILGLRFGYKVRNTKDLSWFLLLKESSFYCCMFLVNFLVFLVGTILFHFGLILKLKILFLSIYRSILDVLCLLVLEKNFHYEEILDF